MKPVYGFDPTRRTNGQAIADLATLGLLEGAVLDLTVGPRAGFWARYRPEVLVTNDLDPEVPAEMVEFDQTLPFTETSLFFENCMPSPELGPARVNKTARKSPSLMNESVCGQRSTLTGPEAPVYANVLEGHATTSCPIAGLFFTYWIAVWMALSAS